MLYGRAMGVLTAFPLEKGGEKVRWKDLAQEHNTRMAAWLKPRPRVTH